MFSADTRQSFSELLENLDWDVRGWHVYRAKRKWAETKKRLRFQGCRPPHPWEKDPHALRPYSLAPAASLPLFPPLAVWSAIPKRPARGPVVTFRPIANVFTSIDD